LALTLLYSSTPLYLLDPARCALSPPPHQTNDLLLGLVSGGFVYLATMTVMPELLEGGSSGLAAIGEALVEVAAFGAGVAMMVTVAMLEMHAH
jgi:zinc transporter ZupT